MTANGQLELQLTIPATYARPGITVGIDPGLSSVSIGLMAATANGGHTLSYRILKPKPKLHIITRLEMIRVWVAEQLTPFRRRIERIGVEVTFVRTQTGGLSLSQARGAILLGILAAGIDPELVINIGNSKIKKQMTGKGNAKKPAVIAAVNKMFNLSLTDDNLADAVAIAYTTLIDSGKVD